MQRAAKGLLEINGATLLLGFTALFPKLVNLPPQQIIFWRSAVAALALVVMLLARRRSFRLENRRAYLMVVLLGALLGAHWILYFHAVQISNVAIGIVSLFTFPVITVLLEPAFNRARIDPADVVTALAVLAGVLLMVPGLSLESSATHGVALGVCSALLYSLRNIFQKKYLSGSDSAVTLFFQVTVAALLLLPVMPRGFGGQAAPWALQLVALGLLFTAFPHSLLLDSLRHLKAKTLGIVQSLQPAYGIALAALLLGEYPSLRTLGGGAIILGAALYESIKVSRPRT
ncbi:MAG: DMT family transporter [Deltaproteobacteria bacterium]|nr:DMT family transporter [Deltaproteobacteria bacterium]